MQYFKLILASPTEYFIHHITTTLSKNLSQPSCSKNLLSSSAFKTNEISMSNRSPADEKWNQLWKNKRKSWSNNIPTSASQSASKERRVKKARLWLFGAFHRGQDTRLFPALSQDVNASLITVRIHLSVRQLSSPCRASMQPCSGCTLFFLTDRVWSRVRRTRYVMQLFIEIGIPECSYREACVNSFFFSKTRTQRILKNTLLRKKNSVHTPNCFEFKIPLSKRIPDTGKSQTNKRKKW